MLLQSFGANATLISENGASISCLTLACAKELAVFKLLLSIYIELLHNVDVGIPVFHTLLWTIVDPRISNFIGFSQVVSKTEDFQRDNV